MLSFSIYLPLLAELFQLHLGSSTSGSLLQSGVKKGQVLWERGCQEDLARAEPLIGHTEFYNCCVFLAFIL